MYQPANERVRLRIKEWKEAKGYGAQRELANAVPGKFGEARGDQWVSDIIHGRADLRLKDLDLVADAIGVPPGELVRKNDRNYQELTMAEARLIQFYRSMPDTVRHGFLTWLEYFFRAQEADSASKTSQTKQRTAQTRLKESRRARRGA